MYKATPNGTVALTQDELAQMNAMPAFFEQKAAEANRNKRNALLAETDYLALSDNTMSAEMTTYRQALRDITSHANWPNLEEADWPTKPE